MSDQFVKCKNINRRLQTEYLINNILDQDFQAMLFPLNFVQSCILMPRFSIINNFITPDNHVSFYIKSIIGCTVVTSSHVFRFLYYHEATRTFGTEVVTVLLYFDFIFFSLFSIFTHVVNSFQRSYVVELIIKLQHVLDYIKTDKRDFFYKLKIQNWLSVLFVVSMYLFHWISACYDISIHGLLISFYLTVPLIIFDMQLVHVTRYVVMIKNELIAWIHKMEEFKRIHDKPEEEEPEVSESDMFNAYTDILKAFRLSNKVYQFSITIFGFQMFIHILINLQYVLELEKVNLGETIFENNWIRSSIVLRNIKNFIYLVTLSIACENFYRNIKLAESSCAQILSNNASTGMRKTCKNVLRLNRASLRKMSAFGVFELNAAFPLRLLGVLVTYSVVLLQFAFLSS
ncbi:uncharacterized protein LOC134674224 [Cydia fagiglandana]|uniref:uncharacterized protein LOC134674224 n=1 Tax=Cydia fagiglandana TaxID=1458189 RepID=UPI002FEDFA72